MGSNPRLAMGSLFPGFPDEIGLECLVRVELNSHHNLRCVCKSWNAVLKSSEFHQERKRLKISEQRICMLLHNHGFCLEVTVYDMQKGLCKALPPIPARTADISGCYFVKQKLVVFTFMLAYRRTCIWLFDFSCSKWREGAKIPRRRIGFASAADDRAGLIYVAGGLDMFFNAVRSAAVYNVEEDKWDRLPDMNNCMGERQLGSSKAVFADGRFYVTLSPTWPTFEVFDSYTRSWKTLENRFNSMHFLSVLGRLHCFSSKGLIEYDYDQDKLHIVGPRPTDLPTEDCDRSMNCALVVDHKIYLTESDPVAGLGFYMLAPPTETGGPFKLIGTERALGLQGSVITAATQVDL